MSAEPTPFTDEELTAAAAVPMTDEILYQALRIGTQALESRAASDQERLVRCLPSSSESY